MVVLEVLEEQGAANGMLVLRGGTFMSSALTTLNIGLMADLAEWEECPDRSGREYGECARCGLRRPCK